MQFQPIILPLQLHKTISPRHITGVKWMSNRKGEIRFHIEMIVPVPFDFDGDSHMDLVVGDEDGLLGASPARKVLLNELFSLRSSMNFRAAILR